ncbi:MAG: hypothetical protein EAZ30_14245 [Betaproteobacteria bacterium]|nr:MAG: hypothetical protein EAZ30_14245 [Betaproteobacteria bacterium]
MAMATHSVFLRVGALAFLALSAGCAQQWESVLDGTLYTRTHMNRFPVVIVAVDGVHSLQNPRYIDAGVRRLTIEAPPVAGFAMPVRREFTFTVERCVRYWLAAQRANALTQDFELVIDHAEPVPGCRPNGIVIEPSIVVPATIDPPRSIPVPKRP